MTAAPHRPCKHSRCAGFAVAGTGYCSAHQSYSVQAKTSIAQRLDERRGSAHARGYDATWSTLSRGMRTRYPVSAGYLTRTPFWTPELARQFHARREAAAAAGQYSAFFQALARSTLNSEPSTLNSSGAGLRFLERHPIYEFHRSLRLEAAQVTDHIIPHRGDLELFWAEWNLQPLSKRQHDEKTATHDGGFRGAPPAASSVEPPAYRAPAGGPP